MVDALLISHEQKIVQKNLKLSSVLLVKDQKNKICDFNAAKQLETFHLQTWSNVGTLAYMPSEIISDSEYEQSYPADIWSLGCIVYELMTGKIHFIFTMKRN